MLVNVNYNLSQGTVVRVKEVRLTKAIKTEIKEKMINGLTYKDLSTISKIRGAEIVKMSYKEETEYLRRTGQSILDINLIEI